MTIPAHPYAKLFPMLSDADGAGLRLDLSENGQRERIILLDGMILDGRNRQRQLEALGLVDGTVPPDGDDLWISRYRRFNPAQDGDPLAFVLSLNLHRRHLSESQRAMVAADLANLGQGARTDLAQSGAADSSQPSANLPKVSQGDAADMLHVSTRSVTAATRVREHGAEELIDAVKDGNVAVSTAADIASLPVGEQLAILSNRDPKAFKQAVRDLRANQPRDARSLMNSRVQPPDDLDYSPTPPWATRALLRIVLPHLGQSLKGKTVLEPACGEGHISAVLAEAKPLAIWASDIWDYSVDGVSPHGWVGVRDYLDGSAPSDGVDWVITNSPFGTKAEAFALRALAEAEVGVAMFVRLGWLASNGRYERLFSQHPPTLLAIFAEDVPLHMGRWEPNGSTASDYIWIIWIKGEAPRAPFWIPPGQRKALAEADDVERFTAHPVRMRAEVAAVGLGQSDKNASTHAASEAIAVSKAEALEIIRAEYTGDNGQDLADRLGRPVNTIRKWAWEAGVSDQGRNTARLAGINSSKGAGA